MPFTVLHFAPTSRGAGDGSSPANAAELFPGGNINSLLTANNYATSGIVAMCQNTGTYTLSQGLTGAVFSGGAPSNLTYSLSLVGCDVNGVPVTPSDYGWRCEEGDLDTTGYVSLNFTLVGTSAVNALNIRMMFFSVTSSTSTSAFSTPVGKFTWCKFSFTATASTAVGFAMATSSEGFANCQVSMTGTNYARIVSGSSSGNQLDNVRIKGDPLASGGTRYGLAMSVASAYPSATGRVFVCDVTGFGVMNYNAGASAGLILSQATIVNCATGIAILGGASSRMILSNVVVTGCAVGVNASSGLYVLDNVVLRNTSNFGTAPETPVSEPCTFITAETDSQLYTNHAAGDYRIKSTSAHWGKNRGAGDEAISGAGNPLVAQQHGIYMGSKGVVA